MTRILTLTVVALTFALAAPAIAHDEGGPYTGTDCGGRYHSPFTGADWLDCYANDDQIVTRVTWDGITSFDVYRLYAHIRNGLYSHHAWRYVYTFR